jgi:hypothetical protein
MFVSLIDYLLFDKGSQPVSEYNDSVEGIIGSPGTIPAACN